MRGRATPARLVLVLYAAVELLSPYPGFHRHANELGAAAAGPVRMAAASAAARPSAPECPACAILGLSALATTGASAAPCGFFSARTIPAPAAAPLLVAASTPQGRAPPTS